MRHNFTQDVEAYMRLIEPKRRRRASEAERDARTRDLFEGVTT